MGIQKIFLYKIYNRHQQANIVDKFITVLNNPHVSSSSIHTGALLQFKSSIVQTPSCLLRMSLHCNGLHLHMPGPKSKDISTKKWHPTNKLTKYHKQKEETSLVMGGKDMKMSNLGYLCSIIFRTNAAQADLKLACIIQSWFHIHYCSYWPAPRTINALICYLALPMFLLGHVP